jgi:hypothetical protein
MSLFQSFKDSLTPTQRRVLFGSYEELHAHREEIALPYRPLFALWLVLKRGPWARRALFLGGAVAVGKNLILFNEELLVALTFFAFLTLVYHFFGAQIGAALDHRRQQIREALTQEAEHQGARLEQQYAAFHHLTQVETLVMGLSKGLLALQPSLGRALGRQHHRGFVQGVDQLLTHSVLQDGVQGQALRDTGARALLTRALLVPREAVSFSSVLRVGLTLFGGGRTPTGVRRSRRGRGRGRG